MKDSFGVEKEKKPMVHNSKARDMRFWARWLRAGAIKGHSESPFSMVPVDYWCSECGATGCKLWCEYQTMCPRVLCCRCACKDQGKTDNLDEDGRRTSTEGAKTDQIGWYVPAVPAGPYAFWSYGSVPHEMVQWWRKLPTRAKERPFASSLAA